MKPPRFSLRTVMIAIALAALATWGCMLLIRSREFAAKASEHKVRRDWCEGEYYNKCHFKGRPVPIAAFEQSWAVMVERQARFQDHMYHKYRRAALFPWLATSPDPAQPEYPNLEWDLRHFGPS